MNHSPENRRIDAVATGSLLTALVFWALGPLLMTYLTVVVDSWTQNALRYSVACAFWLPVLWHFKRAGRLHRRLWRLALLPAGANIAMQILWAESFYHLGPALAVLLSKTSVLWVAGISLVFFPDERPLARSPRFWMGLGLSAVGLSGVLFFKEDFSADGTLLGVVIGIGCAAMWALYTIAIKVKLRGIDARVSFGVVSLYTVAGLWIAALIFGEPQQCYGMGARPWLAVVASAITAISLAHVLYYLAIQRIGATIPVLVILSQPLLVLAGSSVAFGERFTPGQLLCGVLLLVGAAVSVWAQEDVRKGQSR